MELARYLVSSGEEESNVVSSLNKHELLYLSILTCSIVIFLNGRYGIILVIVHHIKIQRVES